MANPYENCPVYENEAFLLRLVNSSDAPDLLSVYSDKKAVPLFNGDNCHGDTFYYQTLARMEEAITFWLQAYQQKAFVRWAVVAKQTGHAIGTIELFRREASDYFNDCGLLRLDLRSSYERAESIFAILSLIVPPAFSLFQCQMVATKIPSFASQRKAAAEKLGFALSPETLVGGDDGKTYRDYYVLWK